MFAGKRFLLTHTIIQNIMGSTVVVLELAEYLISEGADVLVYCPRVGDPARKFFTDKNVFIIGDDEFTTLYDFDYIWVHSQVLPLDAIRELAEKVSDTSALPVFLFNHMSAIEEAADEFPYIVGLEDKLSSMSLAVSTEVQAKLNEYLSKRIRSELYRNPAPVAFSKIRKKFPSTPKKVLIVSNHIPDEILTAKQLLTDQGLSVTVFGESGSEYTLVTPGILKRYDVVISIGKTVQYCLVSGTPVYVYDHFGGCGYLDKNNYVVAMEHNFSGRGFKKNTAETIARSIVDDYSAAKAYYAKQRKMFTDEFLISNVFPELLQKVEPIKITAFNSAYGRQVMSAMLFAKRFYVRWGELIDAWDESRRGRLDIERVESRLTTQTEELETKQQQMDVVKEELENSQRQVDDLKRELELIRSSAAYKAGERLASPVRKIKTAIRRNR